MRVAAIEKVMYRGDQILILSLLILAMLVTGTDGDIQAPFSVVDLVKDPTRRTRFHFAEGIFNKPHYDLVQ